MISEDIFIDNGVICEDEKAENFDLHLLLGVIKDEDFIVNRKEIIGLNEEEEIPLIC